MRDGTLSVKKAELIYLACPYSHADPKIKERRFNGVNLVASKLMNEGYYIFSPISHTHPIAIAGGLPENWKFWSGYDTEIIKNCKALYVLKLDGWEISTGVQAEIKIAENLGIPVRYLDFGDFVDVEV